MKLLFFYGIGVIQKYGRINWKKCVQRRFGKEKKEEIIGGTHNKEQYA